MLASLWHLSGKKGCHILPCAAPSPPKMRVGFVLAALLPLAAALVPALRASRGGRSSPRRRLAPRDVLEAEFDRLARGQPVVVVDAAAAAPLLSELIADGDLGADELRAMWGPGGRDKAIFLASSI